MLYKLLLYIHISSVILSIGPFVVLIPMIGKLRSAEASVQGIYLDAFRFVVRLSKHAGHVLVASGILLVIAGPWTWGASWIAATIFILVSSLFFLARAFSPTIRKIEEHSQKKEAAVRTLHRAIWMYLFLLMVMLWLMVAKPVLW
ncbi:hypothetical protein [Priestia abyssalis]|uniref:hypothetical protein n=1 Tax=Priestia abyssalis TaxID=1221450 RepID=UPI001957CAE8|nr:hypothetical protein [Priestia abyssalis]